MSTLERRKSSLGKERSHLVSNTLSNHGKGWVDFSLGMQPQATDPDYKAGYAEARSCAVSQLTAYEE